MTKSKYNRHITQSRSWIVRITPEIAKYLCVPTKYGASRLTAFVSLLSSAVETTTTYEPQYGRTFKLEPRQLVIAITDLAERWNWARETVRKFLDQLERFNLLTKEKLDRCSLITMNMEWADTESLSVLPFSSSTFVMPDDLSVKMDKWLRGDIADADLLETIGDTVDSFESTDVNVLSYQIVSLQYSLIWQLIRSWTLSDDDIPDKADDVCRNHLYKLFFTVLSGNWVLWLSLLKERRTGITDEAQAMSAEKEPAFISDGRAILDSLFHHLEVDFNRDEL